MKLLCDRQQLHEAFSAVSGTAPTKTTKPILQSVFLRAADDSCTLFSTDGEMSMRVSIDGVKVKKAGTALLPAREASALLRELDDATMSLEVKDKRCQIQSGSGTYVLVGEDPDQFPSEPKVDEKQTIEIPAGQFIEMVRRTSFAAAREETRFAINGLLLDCDKERVNLVGTDGRRLSITYTNLDHEVPQTKVVVPNRALTALGRVISDESEETLQIRIGTNQIAFCVGEMELVSQLADNRFPDYEAVVPKAAETTIDVDRKLLERSLRRVAILSSGDVRMVRIDFDSGCIKMTAENSSVGRGESTIDADIRGAGGSAAFNPDYLLDALKVTDLEVVRIDLSDDATPAKFTLGESHTYVLMPISGS